MTYVFEFEAHADGFTAENVYANIGNRKMAMFIKINPPILTSENITDRYVQFRFFDANTNSSIHNVSFFLNVTKGDQKLMYDLFYAKDGFMTIKFQPGGEVGKWTVYGDRDPIYGGWYSETGQVNVGAPILSQGGLYHFNTQLKTIDFPNEPLQDNVTIMFNSYLSVGDISSQEINYTSKAYNTTVVSYYDKTSSFSFYPSNLKVSWSMPFDWDPTRYQDRPFLVHEELRIPDSFKEFVNTPMFSATVNGIPMNPDKIVLDTYSIQNTTIVHLFVNKDDIQKLSPSIGTATNTMNFAVSPSQNNIRTSSDIFTDFGGWEVKLGWSPQALSGGTANNVSLAFFDQLTGKPVRSDVNYDFKILGTGGGVIVSESNLVAGGGTDVRQINLPSNGIYTISVSVTSLLNNGISDTTRNGVARGNMVIPSVAGQEVIPEFPAGSVAALIIGTISIILVSTRSRLMSC